MYQTVNELVLQFFSRASWDQPGLWKKTLTVIEKTLNDVPTKLDDKDPLRRNYGDYSLDENANFITSFGSKETSRWIFGNYRKKGISFSVQITKSLCDRNHSLNLHLPASETELAESLFFQLLNVLDPIYAYSDFQSEISAKRRVDFFAVDLQQELVGVFWLTFFCSTYVNHFGLSSFNNMADIEAKIGSDGIMFKLGGSPVDLSPSVRRTTEEAIGSLSFVDPQSSLLKPIGKHVPSYDKF